MNKLLKAALIAAGAVAAGAAAAVFLSAPGRVTPEDREKLSGRNVAHRGLHGGADEPPENSLGAFRAAAEAGYGVELDVHLTADDQLVVLHDDSTGRMCGVDKAIGESTLPELKTLRLAGTAEEIPTLTEALAALDGAEPVILELKSTSRRRTLCEKTLEAVQDYPGDLCVESFDPRIVGWFRRKAPDILRGQLTNDFRGLRRDVNPLFALAASHGLTNFISRPQFIAHGPGCKSPLIRLAEKMGAMSVAWTSRSSADQFTNDAVIFEHYRPIPRYK